MGKVFDFFRSHPRIGHVFICIAASIAGGIVGSLIANGILAGIIGAPGSTGTVADVLRRNQKAIEDVGAAINLLRRAAGH